MLRGIRGHWRRLDRVGKVETVRQWPVWLADGVAVVA